MRTMPRANPAPDSASPTPLGSETGKGEGMGALPMSDPTVGTSAAVRPMNAMFASEMPTIARHHLEGTSPSGNTTSSTFANSRNPMHQTHAWSQAAHASLGKLGNVFWAAYA